MLVFNERGFLKEPDVVEINLELFRQIFVSDFVVMYPEDHPKHQYLFDKLEWFTNFTSIRHEKARKGFIQLQFEGYHHATH